MPGNGSRQAAFYAEIALRSGWEVTADRKRGGDIGIMIQMRIHIGRRSDIAVTEPLLDLFHRHAVCVKHAGVGMPEIVKTDRPQAVLFQKSRKRLRQIAGLDRLAHIVHVNVIEVILTIAVSADLSIQLLLLPKRQKKILKLRDNRKRAAARFRFRPVFADRFGFTVYHRLCNNRMLCR